MARNYHHRKNMNTNFISSTSFKQPSFNFQVLEELNEDGSTEETASESKITDDKPVNVKEEPQHLSRSTDFESNTSGLPVSDSQDDHVKNSSSFESSLPPYDPVTNYLSPRPKFLKYNPDRHRDMVDRQQKLKRIFKKIVEKREEIVEESVGNREAIHENEDDEEEEEEFEDDDKWSLKVFLQYLLVMVVLILMTLTISSMNSPSYDSPVTIRGFSVSETEVEAFSPVMLMARYSNDIEIDEGYKKHDRNVLTVSTKELVSVQHEQPADHVFEDDDELEDLQIVETVKNKEIDFINHEPAILISEKMETYRVLDENEAYGDLEDSSNVNEESEILKPMVDVKGKENANNATNMTYFVAYSVIAVAIFACSSVLYYSMQTEIRHMNEVFDESSSAESFGSKSSRFSKYHESHKDGSSSNQTRYFDFQQSTGDSHSHGSFTVEKKFVKEQRDKTSEVMILAVRRSSRIQNRSISSL